MPQQINKVPPMDVINFTFNYFKNAIRKTNVRSKRQVAQIKAEELRMNPQTLGAYSKRISVTDQFSKTHQQRFIDIMS
ncbi:MAG: hypothetical protein HWN67_20060 [Candidatus Helarchaeota archaeon]|nr:hypothetical protein [Candidatus Helarchaeota archaeon]